MVATMTGLTLREYLCREHFPVLFSFIMGFSNGAETVYPSGAHEFIIIFSKVHVARSLVFCVVFCRLLFVLLSFMFQPLCYLSFFDLHILLTPLVSSNYFCFMPKGGNRQEEEHTWYPYEPEIQWTKTQNKLRNCSPTALFYRTR